MNKPIRTFDDKPATRERVPLLVGITGVSSSGKTFSALRIASGIQRVVGGELFVIDTEARRATHYADRFKFRHIDFKAPFGPLDYLAAIEHCIAKGARTIVIDSMTHEHNGEGGVMDQSERYLDDKCGDDWDKRKRMQMLSWAKPKSERKRLNARIVQLGINAVFCYRASDKIKPVTGAEPIKLGWQPETTSPLHYDMTIRFLLGPGSCGVPMLNPEHAAEKLTVKQPEQFRDWFKAGTALDEDIGERMARWAAGDGAQPATNGAAKPPSFRTLAAAEWQGRPLAEAPAQVLSDYWSAVKEQIDTMPDSRQKQAAERHLEDVLRELDAAREAEAAHT